MSNHKFRELLDQTYSWPDYYEFKFIVKHDEKHTVLAILVGYHITENPSKKGNYVAISARKLITCTDEVIEIYEVISTIKGVISL